MADFVHYHARRIDRWPPRAAADAVHEAPWHTLPQDAASGFGRPLFHVTRSRRGPAARVRAANTAWLVAQLDGWLEARLRMASRADLQR